MGACASPAASAARSTCSATAPGGADAAIGRRGFLTGSAAALGALALPAAAWAAGPPRSFKLYRGDEDVGLHTLAARETPEGLQIDIRILIEVRRLGFRVYVYDHRNQEVWRDGRLVRLASRTDNDGEAEFCEARREGDRLRVSGSGYTGDAPADAAPTSYWNYANFGSRNWFSTQSGQLLSLAFDRRAQNGRELWRVSGDFETTLIYDAQREWRGCSFDARGTPIVYEQTAPGPRFAALT